jgi:hypothetical protein
LLDGGQHSLVGVIIWKSASLRWPRNIAPQFDAHHLASTTTARDEGGTHLGYDSSRDATSVTTS